MPIILEVPKDLQAKLTMQARADGLELSGYCLMLLMKAMPQGRSTINEDSFNAWRESDKLRIGVESWQKLRSQDVYRFYCQWCEWNNHPLITHIAFSKLMATTGIPKNRESSGFIYYATCDSFENENKAIAAGEKPAQTPQAESETFGYEEPAINPLIAAINAENQRRFNASSPDVQKYMQVMIDQILEPGEPMPKHGSRLWKRYKQQALDILWAPPL